MLSRESFDYSLVDLTITRKNNGMRIEHNARIEARRKGLVAQAPAEMEAKASTMVFLVDELRNVQREYAAQC